MMPEPDGPGVAHGSACNWSPRNFGKSGQVLQSTQFVAHRRSRLEQSISWLSFTRQQAQMIDRLLEDLRGKRLPSTTSGASELVKKMTCNHFGSRRRQVCGNFEV